MTRPNTAVFLVLTAVFASAGATPPADTIEDLKNCARLTDQAARLACYDEIGARVLREEPVANTPAPEPTPPEIETPAATADAPLPDDFGNASTARYSGLFCTT